jgi:tRNA G18 (ribose-2'-O)-methylase SpoU
VVETAAGAISLHDWELQRADRPAFNILLGGETKGVHPSIMAALRKGYDEVVYIPMPGFCVSMNVATALCTVLYEIRRQEALGPAAGRGS